MFDRTIPVFTHGLTAMSKILDKAAADCAHRRIEPNVLLTDRLYPDMLPFTRQIQIAADHARRCAARLTGAEAPAIADTEKSFDELKARIAASIAYVATFRPDQFAGSAERVISWKSGPRELSMPGAQYVGLYALPNFYFHLTTAHCILRSNGVPIGKADFLGG